MVTKFTGAQVSLHPGTEGPVEVSFVLGMLYHSRKFDSVEEARKFIDEFRLRASLKPYGALEERTYRVYRG